MWGPIFSTNECNHTFFIHPSSHISFSIYNHIFLCKRGREHLENGLVCSHSLSLSLILQRILPSQGHFWGILLGHPHTYLRNHFGALLLSRGTLTGILEEPFQVLRTLPRSPLKDTLVEPSQVLHYSFEELSHGHFRVTISSTPLLS